MSDNDQQPPAGRTAEFGQGASPSDDSAIRSNLNEAPGAYSVHSVPELQQTVHSAPSFDRFASGVDAMSQNIRSTSGLSSGNDPGSYSRFSGGGAFAQNSNGMSASTHDQSLLSLKPVDVG